MQASVSVETAAPRTKDRGADLFVALLKAHGVQQVMALTGGAIMEGMDALGADEQLEMYIFQTEPGAAWAAVGQARATGGVGVCVVTSGPGATNTITALADAHRDNVPLIIITGQVPTAARNTDAFQETNIVEIAVSIAKKVYYLNTLADMPQVLSEAVQLATTGRPGPVLIDLTKDAQQAAVGADQFPDPQRRMSPTPVRQVPQPSAQAIDDVLAHLRQAERPVIIAGYGIVLADARGELQQLLQVAPCPVVHTLPGKGALPTAHPANYGMLGMHGFYVSNWIVHHADLVLSLGSRYDDRITGDTARFAPAARRLIHFDIDAGQIAKVLPERKLGVVGDLKASLAALHSRLSDAPVHFPRWQHAITEVTKQYPSTYVRQPELLQAQYALEVLNDVVQQQVAQTAQQVTYTTEVGDHQMWASQYVALQDGWHFMTSGGQGAMGSGLPMAIGAQVAQPESLVICLAGDGSLRFSEAELETIVEYNLPVKVLLFNNDGYGIVRMWNHRFYEGRETGVIKRQKDWTMLARANGFRPDCVDRVTAPADLGPVLRRAMAHRRPHFIELMTPYEECLPLMPPGQSFDEMIL